jgi:dipeptidyl aminopeptidase/acylaminoacyl peptidase
MLRKNDGAHVLNFIDTSDIIDHWRLSMKTQMLRHLLLFIIVIGLFYIPLSAGPAGGAFTAKDVLKTRGCSGAAVSPDGLWIAYTVYTPRKASEKAGSSYRELFLVNTRTRQVKPFITGKVSIGGLQWTPDGKRLGFTTRRGEKAKNQVWVIPVDGGEAVQATFAKNGVYSYQWHPTQNKIAYISSNPKPEKEKKLAKKGYGFIFYEENLKHNHLYMQDLDGEKKEAKQLTKGKTVTGFVFSPDGGAIAASAMDKNLVDYRYMFRHVYLVDVKTGKMEKLTGNPGKLGNFNFSPDGSKIAYTRSLDRKDHQASQVFVVDVKTKKEKNLTEPGFKGHVNWSGWKNNKTVAYTAGEGVWSTLNVVPANGGKRTIILNSKDNGISFWRLNYTKDFKHFAFTGSSGSFPSDLFYWNPGLKKPVRLTHVNPWLKDKKLGKQAVIRYNARDGLEIEGLLIYPLDYKKGQTYPLIVVVHGGPEGHYSNSWVTGYSSPGQVWAGKGYAVFYPNYRASTGYGVKFALEGYGDPAGKEFDDIADGIDYLVKEGVADKERVGLGGGSYGGYAAAWFGSYYTKYVRAVVMFVGISDLISKRGTTDIPYEELYVHSGKQLEKQWEMNLKRSPVYYAHQSKSAVLIIGGANDTRVHPSQSLEFHRRLKMNKHPAVRLVQYPGEGHGNRKHPGRIDVLYRTIMWYDWYVKDKKPLDGGMPPLDISDKYGLKLDKSD